MPEEVDGPLYQFIHEQHICNSSEMICTVVVGFNQIHSNVIPEQ